MWCFPYGDGPGEDGGVVDVADLAYRQRQGPPPPGPGQHERFDEGADGFAGGDPDDAGQLGGVDVCGVDVLPGGGGPPGGVAAVAGAVADFAAVGVDEMVVVDVDDDAGGLVVAVAGEQDPAGADSAGAGFSTPGGCA